MKRVLVTGASGLLGLNLALEAAKQHQVFGLTHHHSLRLTDFTVVSADLLEPGAVERLLEQTRPDWVIHCAALANVDECEKQPELAQHINAELPGKLAKHVARGGARLIHISTDAVFDGERGSYTETDQPNPLSVYARTKLGGEMAVTEANPQAVVARVNLFGWSPTGRRSLAEFFFNNLSQGKPVQGFTDVYFCPLLANHLAKILLRMLELNLSGLYHVVSQDCLSKFDFGMAIARQFGLDSNLITPTSWQLGGLTAARSPNLTLSTDKLARDLDIPIPAIKDGIQEFHQLYLKSYPQKIQALLF